jgi:hypothetical protein
MVQIRKNIYQNFGRSLIGMSLIPAGARVYESY